MLTVLTHPACLATKKFSLVDGKTAAEAFGKGKYFSVREVPVTDIVSLAEALLDLSTEHYSFVVRGQCIAEERTQVRRTTVAHGDDPPGFAEKPRQWVCLDVDGAPGHFDFGTPEGCEKAARSALERLPDYVQRATHYWQLSSSAGVKPGVSVHLWFWLDRPMGAGELTRWAEHIAEEAGRPLVDVAVFRTVQPHYVANPVFEFVGDPVALRAGFTEGEPALCLPDVSAPLRGATWKKKLAPLYSALTEAVHPCVVSACASYFLSCGPEASDALLVEALRDATEASCRARGIAHNTYTAEKIREHVESGREFARRKQGATLARDSHGEIRPTPSNVRAILGASPEWDGVLGFDERKDRPVFRKEPPFREGTKGNRTGPAPRDYTDEDDARVMSWLAEEHSVHVTPAQVSSVINAVAKEHSFDPIQEYLRELQWDGVPRVDSWLIDFAGCADSRYVRKVGTMWLISAVARALEPGCKVDTMLVLEGPQGKGKSSLLRELAGGLRYFREGIGDISSVETLKAIQQSWIVEVRELGGVRKADVSAQKAFLDRQNDHYRGSYDRRSTDHYRRCVFAGTWNPDGGGYLHDSTGARRYLPVTVGEIDLEGLREVRDQLWAEARERFIAGEQWHVPADDPDFVEEQRDRSFDDRDDPWCEKIAAALDRGAASHLPSPSTEKIPAQCTSVRALQVLEHVFNDPKPSAADKTRVVKALHSLGWHRRRDNSHTWYVRSNLTVVAKAC